MPNLRFCPTFVAILVLAPAPAGAMAALGTTPQSLLAAMCRATGGARWRDIAVVADDASLRSDGMTGAEQDVVDLRNGRRRTQEVFPAFADAVGVDAAGAWEQDRSGQVHSLNSPEATALSTTDRWLAQRGYCNLRRLPAALQRLSPSSDDGMVYERVDATPPHGRTVTLWIDQAQHRLVRTVMLRSFQTVVTRYSDYRDVHGVVLPFRIGTGVGNPEQADVATISHYRLLKNSTGGALKRPGDAITDARIVGDAHGAVIPFTYGNTKLVVQARINGKGPFPFVLDTGGHAILTPQLAAALGLKTSGTGRSYGAGGGSTSTSYARVDKLQLGSAEIDDQSFLVLPLSNVMTDLGDHPPIAGILGLEVFERFAVNLDFEHRTMTLQTFSAAKPPAGARALPIRFTDDMPLIEATLDGKAGIFGVDTGNSGPPMLFPQWAARHGLTSYYMAGIPSINGGQGGEFATHSARIRSLQIAGIKVPADEVGELTPKNAGATSNPSEAGNLGLPVWKHFMVAFDYRRGEMYLASRARFSLPQKSASAGFAAVKLDHSAFTVVRLTPTGPAAKAGLKPGDKIVGVDGTPSSRLPSLWLIQHIANGKPGTHLHLVCAGDRRVELVLGPATAGR